MAMLNQSVITVVPPSELFGVPDPYVRPPAAPGAPAFPAHVEAPARPPAKPAAFGSSAARPDVARLAVITPDELFGVPDDHRAREAEAARRARARAARRAAAPPCVVVEGARVEGVEAYHEVFVTPVSATTRPTS